MTPAPIPSLSSLLLAATPSNIDTDQLAELWKRGTNITSGWLSKSAWSFALVAHWRMKYQGDQNPCIWVPDYFCNESLAAMRGLGVRLHFYPVLPTLEPDYKTIRKQAKDWPLDIFVLVHYFGLPCPAVEARELCSLKGAWLVEDAAHVLLPISGVGTHGDFVLYSPHKLFALPLGALLLVRPDGPSEIGEERITSFGPGKFWAKELSILNKRKWDSAARYKLLMIWCLKRFLQKFGIRSPLRLVNFFEDAGQTNLPPPSSGLFTLRLLQRCIRDKARIIAWRKRNEIFLDEVVRQLMFDKLEPQWRSRPEYVVPYQAMYKVSKPVATFSELRKLGLVASTWPDLPPEVLARPDAHATALSLRRSLIFVPVHQSLRWKKVCSSLNQPPTHHHAAPIEVEEVRDRKNWDKLFNEIDRANLLQSWSYGETKMSTSGWNLRRLLFRAGDDLIGIVQILQCKKFWCLTLSRVNRGPLFFSKSSVAQRQSCIKLLSDTLGRWYCGDFFSWAPELPISEGRLHGLHRAGFVLANPAGWSSSLIDLSQDEKILYSKLKPTWRNMLSVSQRKIQRVEETSCDQIFEALLANCGELMRARSVGFQEEFYRALWYQFKRDRLSAMLLAVRSNGNLLAATLAVPHGECATYLLGWSGQQGRELRAHHLLIWETILRLKSRGFCWFDTGGIDDELTPGIANFKLGLGGERYSLVGEGYSY